MKRTQLAGVFLALTLASAVWYDAPRLVQLSKVARDLGALPMKQRREAVFEPWYVDAERWRDTIPRGAVVDLVMVNSRARDVAVLTGAMLQPCTCQYFDSWPAWRLRQRAIFLRDDRAANAAAGALVRTPDVVVVVDPDQTPALRTVRGAR